MVTGKYLVWVLAWFFGVACSSPAVALETGGVNFDSQARLNDSNLVLNGAGIRSKFFVKVYAIGLYLPQKANDADRALEQPGPKRVRIVTLRDVGAEMFVEGLAKGIQKNHSATELAVFKPRLDQFVAALKSQKEVAKGSVVTLDLTPDNQTRLSINGTLIGKEIAGEDFYRALMRVWLGGEPAQDDLKSDLLGR
jgi:hypothetical protein